jgi:hypothetical protein
MTSAFLCVYSTLAATVEGPSKRDDQLFSYPKLVLEDKLARTFTVDGCEYISGMTCRISYNGKEPLPSEVFFIELDQAGKTLGPKIRLIYPKLKPGESGKATFRIRSNNPAKIVLQGHWNGPWKDPYWYPAGHTARHRPAIG